MKKVLVLSVSTLLLLNSCGTYTESGAVTGGWFGSVIGSAIGGISGGHRGSDIGTLVGMAGGAIVGAAIGSAADNAEQQRYEDYRSARERNRQQAGARQRPNDVYGNYDSSGCDASNSGDDRLYGFGEDFSSTYTSTDEMPKLEIRNARILDADRNGVLVRGEEARMVFEIYNNSHKPIYRIEPVVAEITGNKHIHVSENVLVESILPGKGIRYTASIKADSGLKNGEAIIRIGVLMANKEITSQTREFNIKTAKK